MFFSDERHELRRVFFGVWSKLRQNQPLEPLEEQLAAILREHPEYHPVLDDPERHLDRDYLPELGETNPFLHMAMHLAILEQVSTDRPAGISAAHREAALALGGPHEAEHRMMDHLAEALMTAQREGRPPDEQAYLEAVRGLAARR
jgi:hypothetical protein